jgi:hypothetical protein
MIIFPVTVYEIDCGFGIDGRKRMIGILFVGSVLHEFYIQFCLHLLSFAVDCPIVLFVHLSDLKLFILFLLFELIDKLCLFASDFLYVFFLVY